MPLPRDLKEVRAMLGGVGYYRKFLRDLSKRIRPITSLLRKGVKFDFTQAMDVVLRQILVELDAPPFLVFSDRDALADRSRLCYVYCDVCIDGLGIALEQEQPNRSVRPIAYISRATIDREGHWTQLDLEAGSIVLTIKRPGRHLWGAKCRMVWDHKALENIGKVGDHLSLIHI